MSAPLLDWTDWVAWRRRVVDHGYDAVVVWLGRAGGAVGPRGYRLPRELPEGKAREWLEASLAEHGLKPEARR